MMLNGSSFIPVNADNAELIKQFETLNNITINITILIKMLMMRKENRTYMNYGLESI